jgi:uncharacterized ferritin-like protein (DUF455 family)
MNGLVELTTGNAPQSQKAPTSPDLRPTSYNDWMHEIRALCQEIFALSEPDAKVAALAQLWQHKDQWHLDPEPAMKPDCHVGRPARPQLKSPKMVPSRKPSTPEGLAALVHSVCHIEFNAINLALDAAWRFAGLPTDYYRDWVRVAYEESTHFELLQNLLQEMGYQYGDFDAHDGLWEMCQKTSHDPIARMALVPRILEARGLDATPQIQAKLQTIHSPHASHASAILDIILRDEVTHVQVGNRWYTWLCEAAGLSPMDHSEALAITYLAPKLRPPFNLLARRQAGFTELELERLGA